MTDSAGGVNWDDVFSSDTEDEEAAQKKLRQRVSDGLACKAEGNDLLTQGLLQEAIVAYRRALSAVWATYRQRKDRDAVAVGVACDLNLALCYIRLSEWDNAKRSADRALKAEPSNAKGLYRRGVAQARLGLLDAAASDLEASARLQPGTVPPEVSRELADIKSRIAAAKGDTGGVVPRGFLAPSRCRSEIPSSLALGVENNEEDVADRANQPWVTAEDIGEALSEVCRLLEEISQRRVICADTSEQSPLLAQIADAERLLPLARKAVEAAVVDLTLLHELANPPPAIVKLEELFECMTMGLIAFRPFFLQQERCSGEFNSLRVCRELRPKSEPRRGRSFDLELIRMGSAGLATPDDFAALLFPPSGAPSDEGGAAWQREAFHRVFQKDASRYVPGATWLLLRALHARGMELTFLDAKVEEIGLAHGLFFASPPIEGPVACDSTSFPLAFDSFSRMDSLTLCTGEDKRIILQQSFTSLGMVHKWLLLRVASEGGHDQWCIDLCLGGLGLLSEGSIASGDSFCGRLWRAWPGSASLDSSFDARFVWRAVRWGATALSAAQPPAELGAKGERLFREAVTASISQLDLQLSRDEILSAATTAAQEIATHEPSMDEQDENMILEARSQAASRLVAAAQRLSLPLQASPAPGAPWPDGVVPDDSLYEAAHRVAVDALVSRKLNMAGLGKLSGRLSV